MWRLRPSSNCCVIPGLGCITMTRATLPGISCASAASAGTSRRAVARIITILRILILRLEFRYLSEWGPRAFVSCGTRGSADEWLSSELTLSFCVLLPEPSGPHANAGPKPCQDRLCPPGSSQRTALSRGVLLQIGGQPAQHGLVPQLAVQRLQDPVALVGKQQQLRRHALALERREKLQPLGVGHAEVALAVDHQRGRLVFGKFARIGARRPFSIRFRVVPWRAAEVPFGEPQLLGGSVEAFLAVNAVVAHQHLEAPLCMRGHPVDHEAAVRSPGCPQASSVHKGILCESVVHALHQVLERLPAVVIVDLVRELLPEAG